MGRLISSSRAIYFELQNTNCEDLCRRYNSARMRAHATRRASIAIFFHPPPQSVRGNPGHKPAKCCSNSRANASVPGLQLEKLVCAGEGAAVEGNDAEKTHSGVFAEQGEFAYLLSSRCVCVSVLYVKERESVCVHVQIRACACMCACVCMCVGLRACVWECLCTCLYAFFCM